MNEFKTAGRVKSGNCSTYVFPMGSKYLSYKMKGDDVSFEINDGNPVLSNPFPIDGIDYAELENIFGEFISKYPENANIEKEYHNFEEHEDEIFDNLMAVCDTIISEYEPKEN